jgi:copper oxidase (laccase) domain-containing protein
VQVSDGTPRTSPFLWNAEVRPGLRVAFTSVAAGNLALHVGEDPDGVRSARRRLEAAMGIPSGTLRFMSQTHSDRVALVSPDAGAAGAGHMGWAPDADGMISAGGEDPLAVLVADCVPIVLADTGGVTTTDPAATPEDTAAGLGARATAVVHAGRAGVVNGILVKAVALLREQGAREISAWIGPSVCGSCYEVPEDMMHEVSRLVPDAAARTRSGSAALDLPAAVRSQLLDAGVRLEPVVSGSPLCTMENPDLYSHRREPGAGRIAGLVWRA